MPKQIGLIKLSGSLGDISFYKSNHMYLARTKGGAAGIRIKTDPKFKRTRENMSEFGHAARASGDLRKLLAPIIEKIKDGRVHNRLLVAVRQCMNSDHTSVRGERKLHLGDIRLLRGFEFNMSSTLLSTFSGSFSASFDRDTGLAEVIIPAFDPDNCLNSPASATHFRFVTGALEWDTATNRGFLAWQRSDYLPVNAPTLPVNLPGQLSAGSPLPVMLVVGLEFAQQVNNNNYSLSDGRFICACIVKIEL